MEKKKFIKFKGVSTINIPFYEDNPHKALEKVFERYTFRKGTYFTYTYYFGERVGQISAHKPFKS